MDKNKIQYLKAELEQKRNTHVQSRGTWRMKNSESIEAARGFSNQAEKLKTSIF